jgi:hypothetical protein
MSVIRASFPGSLVLTGFIRLARRFGLGRVFVICPCDRQRAADYQSTGVHVISRPSTRLPFPPKSIVLP